MTDARLQAEARRLWRYLRDHGWSKQSDIGEALGLRGATVRKIANEYAPHFVSNTTQGYNVFANVGTESIEHSIADLRSRAGKIAARADMLQAALDERRSQQGKLFGDVDG